MHYCAFRCGLRRSSLRAFCQKLLAPTLGELNMRSIYERALGSAFGRLHPRIKERFGFSSMDRVGSVGTGVMEELWHGPAYTLPFLYIGSWRRIMFPERGRDVPFTIEN